MPATILTTEAQALAVLRSFLASILPAGFPIIRAEQNRVASPDAANYAVMTPILRRRLSTNWQNFSDTVLVGSIEGSTLTASNVSSGLLSLGAPIVGSGVLPGTYVTALGTGVGLAGTYSVNLPQSVASGTLYAGRYDATQPTEVTIQVNLYGPSAADYVQIVSTLLRDFYAAEAFAASGLPVAPLYAGEPRQTPFDDAESQYEISWSVDVVLQVNAVVTVAQQFADQLVARLVEVSTTYPDPSGA